MTNPHNPVPARQGRLSEEDCYKKLASIFGGPGAEVSTVNEPSGIDPLFAGDNRIHHLANNAALYIYGNAQGTTTSAPLYRPPGGTFIRRGSGEYEEREISTEEQETTAMSFSSSIRAAWSSSSSMLTEQAAE